MKRIRTSNGRTLEFAYKPSGADQGVLISQGLSEEAAAKMQRYTVTPDGIDLEDNVADYALNLYDTQVAEVGEYSAVIVVGGHVLQEGETIASVVSDTSAAPVVGVDPATPGEDVTAQVDVTGEGENDGKGHSGAASVGCPNCPEVFTGESLSGAKSRLRAHIREVHS